MTTLPIPVPGFLRTEDLERTRLVTAEILYRMPDHQSLLQQYIWQEYDLVPGYPVLKKFLKFWQEKLEGPLFKVVVGNTPIFASRELLLQETHTGLIRVH